MEAPSKFAMHLLSLLNNLWALKLEKLNWEILANDFLVKSLSLFREYGTNNMLHSKLTGLLKSIFSFLLKESESPHGESQGKLNNNLLPEMGGVSPPNADLSPKKQSSKKATYLLKEALEYLHEHIVLFLKNLPQKQRGHFLFRGFVTQLCRLVHSFEKRGHPVVKNSHHWKEIYYNFLFLEAKREDKVLVEDPNKKHDDFDNSIGLPPNFKINDASLQGKMNLQTNYDSLGNQGMILDDDDEELEDSSKPLLQELNKHKKNFDSDSDSESDEDDEDLLQNYSFGKASTVLVPKKMESTDADFKGYDSGVGKGVDLTVDLSKSSDLAFTKSEKKNIYDLVNDWNIYGQGSWKALGKDLRQTQQPEKQPEKESEVVSNTDDDADNLQRHQFTRRDNKKYGLYGSLTRRFQVKNKLEPSRREPKISLENFYDSTNPLKGKQVKVDR